MLQDGQDRRDGVELQPQLLHFPQLIDVLVPVVELVDRLLPHQLFPHVLLLLRRGVDLGGFRQQTQHRRRLHQFADFEVFPRLGGEQQLFGRFGLDEVVLWVLREHVDSRLCQFVAVVTHQCVPQVFLGGVSTQVHLSGQTQLVGKSLVLGVTFVEFADGLLLG